MSAAGMSGSPGARSRKPAEWLERIRHSLKPSIAKHWQNCTAYYVVPHIGRRLAQEGDGSVCDALYARLLAKGRIKAKPRTSSRPTPVHTRRFRQLAGRCPAARTGVTTCAAAGCMWPTIRCSAGRFRKIVESADLPKINLHGVRHSYASAGQDAKIDRKALSERIGHSDVAFTMRQYVQTDLEVHRQVATALAELILGSGVPASEFPAAQGDGPDATT